MRVFAVLVAGFGLAFAATAAGAAPTKTNPAAAEAAMQVHVVRSSQAGCEPRCAEWIAAQGKIEPGTLQQFKRVLSQLGQRKLPVLVDSAGGSVEESFAIGRLIRAKGLDVVVTKTVFTTCAATDAACRKGKAGGARPGLPEVRLSKCASACAFILAGGSRRFVGLWTFVGVHQIQSFQTFAKVLRTYRVTTRRSLGIPVETRRTLVSERKVSEKTVKTATPERTYDKIRAYFAEMGIGESIMPLLLSTPHTSVHWLTRNELRSTRIGTDWIDGEQVLAGVAAPAGAAGGMTTGSLPDGAAARTTGPDDAEGVTTTIAPGPAATAPAR